MPDTNRKPLVFDAWTGLSFKRSMGNRRAPASDWTAPTWVGDLNQRRLQAYRILYTYLENSARVWLTASNPQDIDDHREYGDAALLRDTILDALLGEGQDINTQGADTFDPEADDPDPALQAAAEFQQWLRQWAEDERLPVKMIEVERDAIGLGDGVYSLGWSADKQRPRLRTWDPGFYFPVLDDGNEDDYPGTVHLAWEIEADQAEPGKRLLRRITWRIASIPGQTREDGQPRLVRREQPDGGGLVFQMPHDGDTVDDTGTITRLYAWNDEPSTVTCLMSDATWTIDAGSRATVYDLRGEDAKYARDADGEIRDRDLMIDFIPVVHIPNTVARRDHFGRSSLTSVLQILDDLANSDTDLQAASATAGKPITALSGGVMGPTKPIYQAGAVWEIGQDGKLTTVDTTSAVVALSGLVSFLLSRMSTNARTPESLLGRVKPSEVPSGVALALSFGPLTGMVNKMRLVRQEKYPLLLKFAHRIAQAAQMPDVPDQYVPSDIVFGTFLPQDTVAAADLIVKLLSTEPPAIGLETAVQMAQQAGVPIDSVFEEVRRIRSVDFLRAQQADDLGSTDLAFEYMGRDVPDDLRERPTPPTIEPPAPVPPEIEP